MDSPRGEKGCRIANSHRNERWWSGLSTQMHDVPSLMRQQKENTLLGNIRELGGEVDERGGQWMGKKEAVRYRFDSQDLEWYEVEQREIPGRRTSVLAVPGVSGSRLARISTLPARTSRSGQDDFITARLLPLARDV